MRALSAAAALCVNRPTQFEELLFCTAESILLLVTHDLLDEGGNGTAEALRLLSGRSDEVARAISMLDSAAARRDAAALERQALFEAVGCGRPQSWERAFDCLQLSAEAGHVAAREQLVILARAELPPGGAGDWRSLRARVSLEELLRVPARRAICDSPTLRVIEGFASAAECRWLIDRARDRLQPATVVDPEGALTVEGARTNRAVEFQLADMDVVLELVRARISAATRLPLPLFQPTQLLNYAPGQEFRPHHDYFDPQLPGHAEQLKMGQRIATFLIYLNEDYEGGETSFPRVQLSYRGRSGDALFLANVDRAGRPDPMSLHSGTPPSSGEKWILSQWIRDKVPVARN